MRLRSTIILLLAILLSGCVNQYKVVKDTNSAAYIRFERKIADPILGSITSYIKVDAEQQCRQAYADQELMARHNRGNPLVSDLNVDGLYVKPGYFRIRINTVAGGANCDVFVGTEIEAGQKYKVLVEGNVHISVNKCLAKVYKMTGEKEGKEIYEELIPVEYKQCNF